MDRQGERDNDGGAGDSDGRGGELEKPIDWRSWWRDAGAMGISPSEFEYITPYEFNLLREGYHKNMESLRGIGNFQAWVTYAVNASAAGVTPTPLEEWLSGGVPDNTPESTEIDATYKAEQEAKMNQT